MHQLQRLNFARLHGDMAKRFSILLLFSCLVFDSNGVPLFLSKDERNVAHAIANEIPAILNASTQAKNIHEEEMSSEYTLQLFLSIPWGDSSHEILQRLEDYALFSYVSPEQMRKVRAPLRIRVDYKNGVHACADASLRISKAETSYIYHFDFDGKLVGRTLIAINQPEANSWQILDYVVDADYNCYLLEQMQSPQSSTSDNRLRKTNIDGKIQWSRTGPFARDEFEFSELKGTFKRLLMDGHSRLYLPATEHAGAIAEIDPAAGNILQVYTSDKYSNEVFVDAQGTVFYVLYFPEANRRGLGAFNLADQRLTAIIGGEELYGWLLYPFGVDASSNLYVWNNSAIARVSFEGQIRLTAALNNIVVRSQDGVIFSSYFRLDDKQSPAVQVERHSPGGGETGDRELHLPKELHHRKVGDWKLIHVDVRDRYYVFGGEEPGRAGTLLIYSNAGELQETISPPPDLLPIESKLESHQFWQVDAQGRIYLPIADAEGFKVVRLTKS